MFERLCVTRSRRDATLDPGSSFIYLRDIRSGVVWSPTYQPTRREPASYTATFLPDTATFESHDEEVASKLEIAVSAEHDIELRLLQLVNHSERVREIDVTSYIEVALAQARDDFAHPAFGKLFIETEFLADRGALICHRRPRDSRDPGTWAVHVLSLEGRPHGPIEWETDRARFIGRGRSHREPDRARRPLAERRDRLRARSDPQPAAARAPASRADRSASALPPASPPIAKPPGRWRRPIAIRPRRRARSRWRRRTRTACAAT